MPIPAEQILSPGDAIFHERHGEGEVVIDQGDLVIVQFGGEIKRLARQDLEARAGLIGRRDATAWDPPLDVVVRAQAAAIRSLHDEWGVFAASRIELLPHQLWVTRQVNSAWPTRWLVADDVGLGKTVEAGMILSPLLSRGRVRRLLVLCPANLVEQWQRRMIDMFDIRLAVYSPEADRSSGHFWRVHDHVVASYHTLRLDRNGRQERLLNAEPWDMIVVDEAHHLNDDETFGATLGYRLLRDLQEAGRIESMIFFSGTPHRGKEFNFVSLLSLLRPDLFDSQKPLRAQLDGLPEVMIRNNKAAVTDLRGNRLFYPPEVHADTYAYSPQEEQFYELLTEFISRGEAYARSRSSRTEGEAVMLVLIAMQKLASSSVAAVRRTIRRRLGGVEQVRERLDDLRRRRSEAEARSVAGTDEGDAAAGDELAVLDERIVEAGAALRLVEDEEPALRGLLAAADAVVEETRICTIVDAVSEGGRFAGRSVLFFTEYKATQSLLMSALMARFGDGCVAFINGEGAAYDLALPDGRFVTRKEERQIAAERFNRGEVRFLVATEAAGEGIDLQARCHTLIHVDLPWNPMRLHQRVGRLNRYGQKKRVEVLTLRNPDTVESRIWDRLNEKLESITLAVGQVMDEPEDMHQLVLGMTGQGAFQELFAGARRHRGRLNQWFDAQTAKFGGQDVVEAVRDIVGHSRRFDFRQASALLPDVDLPELRPFLEGALALGGRRLTLESDGEATSPVLSFRTPDMWRERRPAIRGEYAGITFDRQAPHRAEDGEKRTLLGVGHPFLDSALEQMLRRDARAATLPPDVLLDPLVIFRVFSRESMEQGGPSDVVCAVSLGRDGRENEILTDSSLLKRLNTLPLLRRPMLARPSLKPEREELGDLPTIASRAETILAPHIGTRISHRFRYPAIEAMAILVPSD